MKQKKNIYIVDDVNENLQVLGNILTKNNYNISVARNGEQALEGIATKTPDLILLDISMPGIDGFEVCKRLKSSDKTKDIPVIFLTARTQTEDLVMGFKAGGVDYITKPFNSEELLSRVKTHLELKDSREKLVELNATKDKFFRIIAHDLKSPLSTLIGFTSLIVNKVDVFTPDKIKEIFSQLHQSSESTLKLLENLLTWARSNSGEIPFDPKNCNIGELINETIELLKPTAKSKNINLSSEIIENCYVTADKNMLKTILRNLCSNAIKFTSKGGIVKLICQVQNEHILVIVQDTGMGINPENRNKLFRIDKHYTTKGTNNEKGTGLGLLLCKEFIDKHSGKIWVESKEGKGSAFKFTLSAK